MKEDTGKDPMLSRTLTMPASTWMAAARKGRGQSPKEVGEDGICNDR